jgi:hypothetical protein
MRSLLALSLLLAACTQTAPTAPSDAAPDSLDDARALWVEADLDDYRMTLLRSCFCPEDYRGPFEVAIEDGTVAEVTFQDQDLPTDRALTVEALFDLLDDAYAQDAARVDVSYHPTLGYPTSLYVDYDTQVADEEIGYTVERLDG